MLKQHVIGILKKVIKIRDNTYTDKLFKQQGILVFILKILFNPKAIRIENVQIETM